MLTKDEGDANGIFVQQERLVRFRSEDEVRFVNPKKPLMTESLSLPSIFASITGLLFALVIFTNLDWWVRGGMGALTGIGLVLLSSRVSAKGTRRQRLKLRLSSGLKVVLFWALLVTGLLVCRISAPDALGTVAFFAAESIVIALFRLQDVDA